MNDPQEPSERPTAPSAAQSLGAMWLYSLLRFAIFFALFGLLYVLHVRGFLGALVALAMSIPLSLALLVKPRQRLAANLEQRIQARQAQRHDLDTKLAGEESDN